MIKNFATLAVAICLGASFAQAGTVTLGKSSGGTLSQAYADADNIARGIFYRGDSVRITGDRGSASALMVLRLKKAYAEARQTAAEVKASGQLTNISDPKLVRKANGGWEVVYKVGKSNAGGHPFRVCAKRGVMLYFHAPDLRGADAGLKDYVRTTVKRMGGDQVKTWNKSKPTKGVPATNYFPAC